MTAGLLCDTAFEQSLCSLLQKEEDDSCLYHIGLVIANLCQYGMRTESR